jgi:probable DNA metabolism protein
MVFNYKRSKDFNPRLLEKVLKQVDEFGVDYVLSVVSDEAREFYKGARASGRESHQSQAFLRFKEHDNMLIAKAEFENDIVDIVLDHFMHRFPTKKVVIICNNTAYVGENYTITEESPEIYTTFLTKEKAKKDELWETFYNSQYIEARRNRKLAMKSLPKKYWKRFGIEEASKIDKGIPTTTLLDY